MYKSPEIFETPRVQTVFILGLLRAGLNFSVEAEQETRQENVSCQLQQKLRRALKFF